VRRDKCLVEEIEPNHEYMAYRPRPTRDDARATALDEARSAPIEVLFARVESETAAGILYLRNDPCAVRALIERASEPGVRARVAALFARGPAEDDLSRKLAREFGGETRVWLLARIEPYLASPRTLGRERARMCLMTADALLDVDPQEHRAARFIVALFEHDDPGVRRCAVRQAVSRFLAPSPSTAVVEIIRAALTNVDVDDDETFVVALPALLSLNHAMALGRVSTLLFDGSAPSHVRTAVVRPLLNDRPPYRNLPLVLRWLAESATATEQIHVAMWLAAVLPPPWLSRTIARGLADASPSLRDQSRRLLVWLPDARARALVERALRDEPDPYLRRALRGELRSRSSSRTRRSYRRTPSH